MSHYQTPQFGRRSSVQTPQRWRRNQNVVSYASAVKLGPVTHTVLVALMVAVLGLMYLTQVTKTSSYGYELNEIETKRSELLTQKDDLEVETARLQALERVEGSDVAARMAEPEATDYVRQ